MKSNLYGMYAGYVMINVLMQNVTNLHSQNFMIEIVAQK